MNFVALQRVINVASLSEVSSLYFKEILPLRVQNKNFCGKTTLCRKQVLRLMGWTIKRKSFVDPMASWKLVVPLWFLNDKYITPGTSERKILRLVKESGVPIPLSVRILISFLIILKKALLRLFSTDHIRPSFLPSIKNYWTLSGPTEIKIFYIGFFKSFLSMGDSFRLSCDFRFVLPLSSFSNSCEDKSASSGYQDDVGGSWH